MLTEVDAKTKWCPLKRGETLVEDNARDQSQQRLAVASNDGARCKGSACMAWRVAPEHIQRKRPMSKDNGLVGYCGQFGKPE